jgi:hypothetical protein
MTAKPVHSPEIEEDLPFQHRNWRAQRIGWALLGAVVLAGLAGLLGSGPLSSAQHSRGAGLTVKYERFVRHGAPSKIEVTVGKPARTVRIAISRSFLETLEMRQLLPSPGQVRAGDGFVVYVFEPVGSGPMRVTFVFQPDQLGSHEAQIAVDDGPELTIRQFTYP